MGEADFYYFTCLKLPFDNLPSRLPLLLRMHWISVIAFVAVFAAQSDAMPCWTTEVCSAFFKAIGMVTDISKLPVGQIVQRRHFWRASTMSSGHTVRSKRHEAVGQDLRACQRMSAEEVPRLDS